MATEESASADPLEKAETRLDNDKALGRKLWHEAQELIETSKAEDKLAKGLTGVRELALEVLTVCRK